VGDAFAIGDVAAAHSEDGELPMLSPPAMQAGRYVARAIVDQVQTGQPPAEPFRYLDKGTMATIGRSAGVAAVWRLELTGFIGWVTWIVVHVYYLVGFRNRILALASWAWNYLRFDRPIRIILETDRDPELQRSDRASQVPPQEPAPSSR
jgi:NADH dehydrogenase